MSNWKPPEGHYRQVIVKTVQDREKRGYKYPADFVGRCLKELDRQRDRLRVNPEQMIDIICMMIEQAERPKIQYYGASLAKEAIA